jgi:hypothetical protein
LQIWSLFKDLISKYEENITKIQTLLNNSSNILSKIKSSLNQYIDLKNQLVGQLNNIKTKLIAERNIIRVVNKIKTFCGSKND